MVGVADRATEDLAIGARGGDHLAGPIARQSECLRYGKIAAEEPLGAHIVASLGRGHVRPGDPQRLRLDERALGPLDDQPERLIAQAISRDDRIEREAFGQKDELAGGGVEIGA